MISKWRPRVGSKQTKDEEVGSRRNWGEDVYQYIDCLGLTEFVSSAVVDWMG